MDLRKIRGLSVGVTSGVGLVLSACSSAPVDTSFVAERWRASIASFDLDAVFPPRHLEPGEIYLVMNPPDHPDDRAKAYSYHRRALFLGKEDVRASLITVADSALQLPQGSGAKSSPNIFTPLPTTKLNQVGFGGALKVRVDFINGVASPVTHDAIPADKMR